MSWLLLSERIDEIGDKIFFFGAGADGFFFVFYDDFVVGDFDDFAAGDGEFWIEERFDERAFYDDLLDGEIVACDGEIGNAAELGAFFGLDFFVDEVKIESEDFFDLDNVVFTHELVFGIDNHAEIGIFTDGFGV